MGQNSLMTSDLLHAYSLGPQQLADAIADMTPEEIDAQPIVGQWSTRQVVCHIVDFEPIYADRMKRVLVEEQPRLIGGDPDLFAKGLGYERRDLENELALMSAVRKQMISILSDVDESAYNRTGLHSADGPLTITQLLTRITNHVPHHLAFIEEKKKALRGA